MINPDIIFGRLGNKLFQYAYIFAQMKEGKIPDIFIQDPKYFEKYDKEIKQLFGDGIGYLDYVSIHVRRGANPINPLELKYSENPFYVNLSETDYYDKAIEMFPVDKFIVFSDDVGYCKEKWGNNERFKIMDMGDEIEDFNLMASCSKGNIIANSSFSYWSAFLNPSPTKKVVAPSVENWYSDKVERTVCPKEWIRI